MRAKKSLGQNFLRDQTVINRIVDALDLDRSELVRFSSGRVMDITRYVFQPEAIRGVHAFKIPEMARGSLLVSSEIVDAVERAGLRGTGFEQVWADDARSSC